MNYIRWYHFFGIIFLLKTLARVSSLGRRKMSVLLRILERGFLFLIFHLWRSGDDRVILLANHHLLYNFLVIHERPQCTF